MTKTKIQEAMISLIGVLHHEDHRKITGRLALEYFDRHEAA